MNKLVSKRNTQVRYMRLINNMTISELAYKSKIEQRQLEKIERGAAACTELNARRLAEFFGLAYEWRNFVIKKAIAPEKNE